MTIADYLKEASLSQREFAVRIGVSDAVLSRVLNGKRLPTFDMALAIIRETGGKVTAEDMASQAPEAVQ